MARAKEGDQLDISASSWNSHEEVAEWYYRLKANGEGGQLVAGQHKAGTILIKNSSSADRRRGEMLKVGDYLLTGTTFPEFSNSLWFNAALHDGTDAPLAVLLQPIPNGEIGPAQISGVCPALVNFSNADMRYARPAASNDVLQADVLGQVRVLYKPSGTGEKECLVDLSGGRYNGHGKPDSNIAANATGTVSFWNGLSGSEADSTMNCTARAWGAAVTSGKKVSLSLINNVLYVAPWEC